MSRAARALERAVSEAVPRLLAIDEAESGRNPARGKWSPREIIGHLVDSAANNHARFVRAQLTDDLVFPGYAQEEWVQLQGYGEAAWPSLVALWAGYNRHLSRVIARIPDEVANRPRARHNLHEVAWSPVPPHEPATLAWFMDDYVAHLEHHLRQIWAATSSPAPVG